MKVEVTANFKKDFDYWVNHDKKIVARIFLLIAAIEAMPFIGIGKPEPLKYEFSGCWSRRINKEHRIIYRVVDNAIVQLLSCRYHYV